MEGDPEARITPWNSAGSNRHDDEGGMHSNPSITVPRGGSDAQAGGGSDQGPQDPSQASKDWGDAGDFSFAPLDAPAFTAAEQSHEAEHQQQQHPTR